MDKQKALDEILIAINKVSQEQDTLEKIARSGKNDFKKQKMDIENQFEMITNMIKATQSQLLTNLEAKHKSQQYELNHRISRFSQFVKNYRSEHNKANKDDITQIADIQDRIKKEFESVHSDAYTHTNIQIIMDTSKIMRSIPKIAYIQEKTKEEMEQQIEFEFHEDNKNLKVRPQIIALNTNSMNTKICVSWKLTPVRVSLGESVIMDETKQLEDVDLDDDDDDESTTATQSIQRHRDSMSMTDDVDTSYLALNVHEICNIDIEWRYSDDQDEILNNMGRKHKNKNKKKHKGKYAWNILDIDHHKVLAFNLDESIFDHILNTTRYGIYWFRVTVYNRSSKITSKEVQITTFRVSLRHIADEWNVDSKQKQLRIGFFNRKTVTRDIPGKFRHIFGSLIISSGINVWTLKIKKHDPNREKCSAMIGVINMNNRYKPDKLRTLNQCFAHIGIGYGLYLANGDVFHTKNPRAFGREIKEGDIVQIMCDYKEQTISFIVNNISWGIAFDRSHFTKTQNKLPRLGLAVALRGCDEIQICDFVNEYETLFNTKKDKRRRRSSSGSIANNMIRNRKKKIPGSPVEKYGQVSSDNTDIIGTPKSLLNNIPSPPNISIVDDK